MRLLSTAMLLLVLAGGAVAAPVLRTADFLANATRTGFNGFDGQVKLFHFLGPKWNGEIAAATYRGPIRRALKKHRGVKAQYLVLEDNDPGGYKTHKAEARLFCLVIAMCARAAPLYFESASIPLLLSLSLVPPH